MLDQMSRPSPSPSPSTSSSRLTAGGTAGNERLTVITGLLLILLTAAIGVTIVDLSGLIWWHLFLGLLLIGPVALKMASTGYRFLRYYTADEVYQRKGPPPPVLRGLAPLVLLLTAALYASGVLLLVLGPDHRGRLLLIHKVSFIGWLALTAVHVIGHLPEILRFLRVRRSPELEELEELIQRATRAPADASPVEPSADHPLPGRNGRGIAIASAFVFGLVLVVALLPDFGAWTSAFGSGALHHFGH
jgi:hypothetical protein